MINVQISLSNILYYAPSSLHLTVHDVKLQQMKLLMHRLVSTSINWFTLRNFTIYNMVPLCTLLVSISDN